MTTSQLVSVVSLGLSCFAFGFASAVLILRRERNIIIKHEPTDKIDIERRKAETQ